MITLLHRPYVFLFFLAFLIIGCLNRGWIRTLLFLVIGFTVAFLSEVSSIRNGFPYGMYHYVYANLEGEWQWLGVPLWDSLSYTFLAYAAYETMCYFCGFPGKNGGRFAPVTSIVLSTLLMVLLDVVADPLAVRGDRWFLGRIFYYPDGGLYFGVPLSNFAGWLLVAAVIFSLYHLLERKLGLPPPPEKHPLFGPLFYWGILVFNIVITFWIGEVALALTGIGIHAAAFLLLISFRKKSSSG